MTLFRPPLTCYLRPCLPPSCGQMSDMVSKLCSMSKNRVILSFAPNTWYYSLLKKVGQSMFLYLVEVSVKFGGTVKCATITSAGIPNFAIFGVEMNALVFPPSCSVYPRHRVQLRLFVSVCAPYGKRSAL